MNAIAASEPTEEAIDELIAAFDTVSDQFEYFRLQVANFFLISREFSSRPLPLVHSVKSRLKDSAHLRVKIRRKWQDGPITSENIFTRITDLAGVRVLHLYSHQFARIHELISRHIGDNFWSLLEAPIAYSWDPEATTYFESLASGQS
jgi:putative GTP pyrophosphokinase